MGPLPRAVAGERLRVARTGAAFDPMKVSK